MADDDPATALIDDDDPDAVLDRLATAFGAEPIADMTGRFADTLDDAMRKLDLGDATGAHRVAGIAGTLGFAAVGRAWLAVSEDRATTFEDVRRESREALAILARRAGKPSSPSTSV